MTAIVWTSHVTNGYVPEYDNSSHLWFLTQEYWEQLYRKFTQRPGVGICTQVDITPAWAMYNTKEYKQQVFEPHVIVDTASIVQFYRLICDSESRRKLTHMFCYRPTTVSHSAELDSLNYLYYSWMDMWARLTYQPAILMTPRYTHVFYGVSQDNKGKLVSANHGVQQTLNEIQQEGLTLKEYFIQKNIWTIPEDGWYCLTNHPTVKFRLEDFSKISDGDLSTFTDIYHTLDNDNVRRLEGTSVERIGRGYNLIF